MRTLLLIILILILCGFSGLVGDTLHGILHTIGGMRIGTIVILILIIILLKGK